MKKLWFMLAMTICVLAGCSDGGSEDPINPTPKPEEVKTEITIDSGIISNGLSFGVTEGEQSISFSVNANWTLSVASTTSGATWCKASSTSGSKGSATVKFTVDENTGYDERSVSVTIKAGTVSKTFTITQKGADALLVTTTKYEVSQEGGQIEIEVKANIDYKMEISEEAKDWIKESSSRALTTSKHKLDIAMNENAEKREGEITFKSGDKVETVKVYQAGGAILLLSQNEHTVSDAGETISVDIKSNIDFGVQMPDVDWISDEASSRGMSSHTLKYIIVANETYDSRSAEIIFYDKNSDLKDTLKIVQAQKDAIILSERNISVAKEGGTIEVKMNTNVDFEVQIPSEATWISQTDSRALKEKSVYLKVDENVGEESRSATIAFTNKDSQVEETVVINQQGNVTIVTLNEAGTMKKLLGDDYLNIKSLKVVGPINGDDVCNLRKMLGASSICEADCGKLIMLDLSEATIVEGGEWYYENEDGWHCYTVSDEIGHYMFYGCVNLQKIELPLGVTLIGNSAFKNCSSLSFITMGDEVTSIDNFAFQNCSSLSFITIGDNVTSIGRAAFATCSSLKSIDIPDGVVSIGDWIFEDCSSLTSVTIGDGVIAVGGSAFSGCSSLVSVTIGDGVIKIGGSAFSGCSSLASITIGDGVTTIGNSAFKDCSSLTSIDIPDGVTSIGINSFMGCSSLTSVDIPDCVISIGEFTFKGCSSLTSVTIGDGVTSIGYYAFEDCSSLTSVTIGKGVTSINAGAFSDCSSLMDFYCYAVTSPALYNSPFSKYGEKVTLHVPAQCGTKYKSSDWGIYFKTIKEMD